MFYTLTPKGLKGIFYAALMIFLLNGISLADNPQPKKDVGFDEKLGQTIPLNLKFIDETGETVTLKQLIDKPVILTIVYYNCPGLCSPLLSGVSKVIDQMDLIPGKDYKVITISFNPRETYLLAADKKKNYFTSMKKQIPDDSWRFLVGDSANIAGITDAVGFRYIPQGNDYMHGAAIMAISPTGKIARYMYGTDFQPLDVKLALTEASEERTGPAITKLLQLCFSRDPSGKMVVNITRIAGGSIVFLIAVFVVFFVVKKKKTIPPSKADKKENERINT
jgi:protein SCO1/2